MKLVKIKSRCYFLNNILLTTKNLINLKAYRSNQSVDHSFDINK